VNLLILFLAGFHQIGGQFGNLSTIKFCFFCGCRRGCPSKCFEFGQESNICFHGFGFRGNFLGLGVELVLLCLNLADLFSCIRLNGPGPIACRQNPDPLHTFPIQGVAHNRSREWANHNLMEALRLWNLNLTGHQSGVRIDSDLGDATCRGFGCGRFYGCPFETCPHGSPFESSPHGS